MGAEEVEDDLPAPRPGVFFVYALNVKAEATTLVILTTFLGDGKSMCRAKALIGRKSISLFNIAHYEEFTSREDAVAREKELKSTSGRRWLKKAIAERRARQAGGIPFKEKMKELSAELYAQFAKADQLEATIRKNLTHLGFGE